jgi:hypothetical protein
MHICKRPWSNVQSTSAGFALCPSPPACLQLQPIAENDKVVSLQMALKVADVGHLAAPLAVHLK